MNREEYYFTCESIGKFADENDFKLKLMDVLTKGSNGFNAYKKVLAIENSEEPGMPDLLVLDIDDTATFIETKYSTRGVIKFKRTQIPWYRKHKDLNIKIVCYNDLTTNVHIFASEYLLKNTDSKTFKLREEKI